MTAAYTAQILSSTKRSLWRSVAPRIWAPAAPQGERDSERAILRTLFDQPRWLDAYLLYDEKGSRLFELICELPEYYLTRTEAEILERAAPAIISRAPVQWLVELGAGFPKKTPYLLSEQLRQRGRGLFAPIDVSLTALTAARDRLGAAFPRLVFEGLQAQFPIALESLERSVPTLFLFLGSTIGNFTRFELLRFFELIAASMDGADFFLLGVDRVKESAALERAYNDRQGVTAEFILNALVAINRRLGSDFDPSRARYYSRYNAEWQQVEMYAVATETHTVRFPRHGASFVWQKDEPILVEISRKFDPERLARQAAFFGLELIEEYADPRRWFSLLLFRKADGRAG
jgi:L-histidine N-alpha-methyltransferase